MDSHLPEKFKNHEIVEESMRLQLEITSLNESLSSLLAEISTFEHFLRSELTNEIIEVQELTVLYKQQKKDKKEKRLAQKKRGKNYKEPTGLKPIISIKQHKNSVEDERELKRLYKEAMLQVHPDRFSMDESQTDLATEVTTKLISIYQSGNLSDLKSYHSHIFGGGLSPDLIQKEKIKETIESPNNYLRKEIKRLKGEIEVIKSKHLYWVLNSYKNPKSYLYELKAYYKDRIKKLKRRTRTA